ncbi:GatB/YqeY domain-containing protein [Alkaliphilus pronyensis]|uniref:GatB/YqeY domain-containing protein n=1 Tax=Alkaliphilus pronyensis TaxID=1482732 RepID=A0A6I0F9X4_9FIRM|nr:GatB/YqeY domain-containing protein [Alkaliphilus pronyensis]KAB3535346.1 GatB/YqeY domain-containing protein [Alkaliphilus pronyensis]
MSLKELLASDLKEAMKEKNQLRKNVITMIRSDIKQTEVDSRVELTDEDVISIISKQVKQRKDALSDFSKGGRDDLVKQAEEEIKWLMTYLPEQLSEEEVSRIVLETKNEVGASTMKDMGMMMAALMPKLKGKAEGKLVSDLVKKHLMS